MYGNENLLIRSLPSTRLSESSMMDIQQTVFVIDDDPGARESVVALVKSKSMPVEEFSSAEEFLTQFDVQRNGCLIVDMRMQGMSGLELQDELTRQGSHIPVIVITAYGDVPTAVQAMKHGAMSFMEKPCTAEDLWNNIAQALRYNRELVEQTSELQDVRSRLCSLSQDEREVLDHLMTGAPNKAIASRLDIGLRTVESRRATVLKKMRANSLAVLVRKVLLASSKPDRDRKPGNQS
jgi:two-component system, LuxR family, response regulator FixJ